METLEIFRIVSVVIIFAAILFMFWRLATNPD